MWTCEPLPTPCWNVDWLDLVQVLFRATTAAMSSLGWVLMRELSLVLSCPKDNSLLVLPSLWLFGSSPLFSNSPMRLWEIFAFVVEHSTGVILSVVSFYLTTSQIQVHLSTILNQVIIWGQFSLYDWFQPTSLAAWLHVIFLVTEHGSASRRIRRSCKHGCNLPDCLTHCNSTSQIVFKTC